MLFYARQTDMSDAWTQGRVRSFGWHFWNWPVGDYALYEVSTDHDFEGVRPLSRAASNLVSSAERFQPFLALGADAFSAMCEELQIDSPSELEIALTAGLSALFRHRSEFRFHMGLVKHGDLDFHEGTWHWVTGFAAEDEGQVTVLSQDDEQLIVTFEKEEHLVVVSSDGITYPWKARWLELDEEALAELRREGPGLRAKELACEAIRQAILVARSGQGGE